MPLPDLHPEIKITAVRSSGKGGQHVNKVSTKIELRFNIATSSLLSDHRKTRLLQKLQNKLSSTGDLIITVDEERSQLRNKKIAIDRLYDLLTRALIKPKKRKPTKLPKSVKEKRLKTKKLQSEKKDRRRKI